MNGIEMERLRNVDIRTVDPKTLVERSTVSINTNATREERISEFIKNIGNPYCYLEEKKVTKLTFPHKERSMEECISHYMTGF